MVSKRTLGDGYNDDAAATAVIPAWRMGRIISSALFDATGADTTAATGGDAATDAATDAGAATTGAATTGADVATDAATAVIPA